MNHPVVNLRAHHLVCLLTYASVEKGHGACFVENIEKVIGKLSLPRCSVKLVTGADDICAPGGDHVCKFGVASMCYSQEMLARDQIALDCINRINPAGGYWQVGTYQAFAQGVVGGFRKASLQAAFREVCLGCGYQDFCQSSREDGFQGVRLFPERSPKTILIPLQHSLGSLACTR